MHANALPSLNAPACPSPTTPPRSAATSKRPRTGGGGRGGSTLTPPKPVTYSDLGGIEPILDDIRELIEYPRKHPEVRGTRLVAGGQGRQGGVSCTTPLLGLGWGPRARVLSLHGMPGLQGGAPTAGSLCLAAGPRSQVYGWLGVEPPRGVLLHGPPGCGKTALANAIANECGVPFLRVSAPEIVSGMSGESEAKIRQLFQEAAALAPCIVFIGGWVGPAARVPGISVELGTESACRATG